MRTTCTVLKNSRKWLRHKWLRALRNRKAFGSSNSYRLGKIGTDWLATGGDNATLQRLRRKSPLPKRKTTATADHHRPTTINREFRPADLFGDLEGGSRRISAMKTDT